LSNFLGISQRHVFGADMCMNSLKLANEFKERNELERVGFCQMNLFRPAFKDESFHLVICNGVLHHTSDPAKGFNTISKLVKKDGYILVGLYSKYGRTINSIKKLAYRKNKPLNNNNKADLKKATWYKDQYENPHESTHTMDEVLRWFEGAGFEFINSIPKSNVFDIESSNGSIFNTQLKGNKLSRLLAQISLIITSKQEKGFFIMIGKRK